MASFLKFPVSLAMVVLPLAGVAKETEANFLTELARGRPQKIVVYGTSLTANSAWPAALEQTLRDTYDPELQVVNAAGGGKDSRWGLANLEQRVIRQRPDTVFIEFSVNDAYKSSRLGVEESMSNLEEMIHTIHRKRRFCEVIVMIMNPPAGEALEERPRIREYETGYRRIARRNRCRLIDFSQTWRTLAARKPRLWRKYLPDGLHPTAAAARDVILPYLLRTIGHAPQLPPPRGDP